MTKKIKPLKLPGEAQGQGPHPESQESTISGKISRGFDLSTRASMMVAKVLIPALMPNEKDEAELARGKEVALNNLLTDAVRLEAQRKASKEIIR